MKLGADNETLAENKVLILYLLSVIGKPINNTFHIYIIISLVYFQQFLIDFQENKYIINYEKDDGEVYEITPLGRSTLDLTIDMLPRNYKSEG